MEEFGKNQEIIVEDKLGFIQKALDDGEYDVVVKESSTLFELVFKKIFNQAIVALSYSDRIEILETENSIGKGKKGVQDFTFGELVRLYRESNLLKKWSKHTAKDLGLISTLDYSSIVNLRNNIVHQGIKANRYEAKLVFEYLRNLLAVLGFSNLDTSISNSFSKGNNSITNVEKNETKVEIVKYSGLPTIKKSRDKSNYTTQYGNELKRLMIQAENSLKVDLNPFEYALNLLDNKTDLFALDVGCATGVVTKSRFDYFKNFKKVIGIDYDENNIKEAITNTLGDKFSFYQVDIENSNFDENMSNLLKDYNNEKFDFIFSALTMHHLKNPAKVLFKLRQYLKKDGVIIIRSADDGATLAHPDENNLVDTIINLTQQIDGMSDRFHGRKIYYQLRKSGFKNIKLMYGIRDTVEMTPEERYNLFTEVYTYRLEAFKRRLDDNPGNEQYQLEYEWVKKAIDELELMFLEDTFYYKVMDYIAIGQK